MKKEQQIIAINQPFPKAFWTGSWNPITGFLPDSKSKKKTKNNHKL